MTKDNHKTEARADNDQLNINAPATSQNDEPITVHITGADPNSTVEFEASLIAEDGITWQSNATFTPDANGTIDLTEDEPDDGTWSGIESMAWLWSMRPDDEDARFPALGGPTYTVDLRASTDKQTTEHTISRVRWNSETTAREIDHDTVVGTLYEPAGDGPHPAIIDLHGSGGRMSDNGARRYASEGYATLALHYFGDPDPLPDTLEHIPLSYVDDAADWLLDQDSVAGDRVGLVGVSRGAELALALGAHRNYVGCVISYSGSIPWDTPSNEPAWLDDGTPVPHLTADKAPRFADLDEKPVADTTPAIEEANGPILLLSGGSDPVWNSRQLSEAIADRLRERDYSHNFEHRTYDDVGHYLGTPYLPLGGVGDEETQRATAHASEDIWPVVLAYLKTGLNDE